MILGMTYRTTENIRKHDDTCEELKNKSHVERGAAINKTGELLNLDVINESIIRVFIWYRV